MELMIGRVSLDNTNAYTGVSRKIHAQTMIINETSPKHFMYELSSRGTSFDSIAYLLEDEGVLKELVNIISDSNFWHMAIEKVTGAKSGMITPDADNIPFSLVHRRVDEVLNEGKYNHGTKSSMIASMLMVDLLNVLGLMGSPSSLKMFDTKKSMFVDREVLVNEIYKDRVRFALDKLSFSTVEKKKKVSIAGVIDAFESNVQDFVLALDSLRQIPKEVETLISLVRAFVCNDYTNIDEKDLYFFEQPEFLEVARNFSFIQMAIGGRRVKDEETGSYIGITAGTSPVGNSNYWSRCLTSVMSSLKSSSILTVVEMNALKEYFTITTIEELRGFRKGVCVSKNLAEATPFQVVRVMSKTDLGVKLSEDKTAQSAFGTSHALACRLNSQKIHNHVHTMLTSIVNPTMDPFLCNLGIDGEDLNYLAAIFASSLEVDLTNYAEMKALGLVYVITTEDSNIMDGLPTVMGIAKTTLPDAVLLYANEVAGSKVISFKEPIISETKNVGFTNITEAFTDDLGVGIETTYSYGGERIKMVAHIDELAGLVNLDDTYAIKPLIGRRLFDSLFAAHNMILNFTGESKNSEFGVVANLTLIKLLKEVIESSDVDNLMGSALSLLWQSRKASQKGEAKFSHSLLAQEHVKAELRVRLALILLTKLGFVTNDTSVEIVGNFRKAGAFDLYQI